MSEIEKKFNRCDECPLNPNKLSNALVKRAFRSLGIGAVESRCPGPDIIDRFEAVSQRSSERPPKGFTEVALIGSMLEPTAEGKAIYYKRTDRTEQCQTEPITIHPKETVAAIEENDGQLWVQIGTGKVEDVIGAAFDLDLDGRRPNLDTSPEEYLTQKRTVIYE